MKINYYNKKYILDGYGISNKAIKEFFDKNNIFYTIYDDFLVKAKINISEYDYLIKSPGVPLNQKLIVDAKEQGIPVISDLELFYLLKPNQKYISVTGSNGKTTVTYFIHQFLNMLNIPHHLAGNIGIPLFSIIEDVKENELVLIECSSFMLEAVNEFSPQVHIITNIYPHHLAHHKSFKQYLKAKMNPLKDGKDMVCIYPSNCRLVRSEVKKRTINSYSFSNEPREGNFWINNNLVTINEKTYYLKDLEQFNNIDQLNILVSLGTIDVIKKFYPNLICMESIINRINSLKKYPYRQQVIIDNDKLLVINDSKATNYYATYIATENLKEKHNNQHEYKILIAGGEKQDYKKNSFKFLDYFDHIILFGENKEELGALINKYIETDICNNLEEALEKILKIKNRINNQKRLLILFSPMSASHDQYKSYVERGQHFNKLINVYQNLF